MIHEHECHKSCTNCGACPKQTQSLGSGIQYIRSKYWKHGNCTTEKDSKHIESKCSKQFRCFKNKPYACTDTCKYTFSCVNNCCLLYTSPSPRDGLLSRM